MRFQHVKQVKSADPCQRKGDKRWNKKPARKPAKGQKYTNGEGMEEERNLQAQNEEEKSRGQTEIDEWPRHGRRTQSARKKTNEERHRHLRGLRPAAGKLELISCWFRSRRDILGATGKKARSGLHWHGLTV